jgi:hypothetical protein
MNRLRKWLKGNCGKRAKLPGQHRCRIVLDLELLETRVTPIVAKNVIPAPVVPGGPYDGVVLLNRLVGGVAASTASGSLIAQGDGHYILTAAHNDRTGAAAQVTFNLQRDGTPVNIVVPVPANPAGATTPATRFVINNPTFVYGGPNPLNDLNDIALWKLVDPVNPQPNRLLVAPYGAQQYGLYTATDEVTNPGRTVTVVGYGRTGTGAPGDLGTASAGIKRMGQNTIDTLGSTLRNQVTRIRFAGPGTFRVGWRGAWQTTPPLTAASPPATVLGALSSISLGGSNPLAGNVTVQAVPGMPGSWWLSFANGLASRSIPGGWLRVTAPATVATVVPGGSAAMRPGLNDDKLIGDFDNGLPQNDAMGLLYGINQAGVAPVNAVQTITVSGAPTGGTFQLAFQQAAGLGPPPAPVLTAPINWNAPANGPGSVNDALQALAPLAGNVLVAGGPGPGTPYSITFVNGLAGADVNQLTVRNAALIGGTNPQVTVTTTTRGSDEVGTAHGDSGGPVFIGNQIAGVAQAVAGFGGSPPFTGPSLTTFGSTLLWSRVSSYATAGRFIPTSTADTTPYDLVLDMQDQVAGAARNAAGNWDNLTITASRGGPGNANLLLTVTDPNCPQLSGTYFTGRVSTISSLTLRGGAGDDTFIIQGDLGIRTITVDGRGGNNALVIQDDANTTNNIRYTVSNTAVSAGLVHSPGTLCTVNYAGINAGLDVNGSQGYNQFLVTNTPPCLTTLNTGTGPNDSKVLATTGDLDINGQNGIDIVRIGNAGNVQGIQGHIDITNTRGWTSLVVDDSADNTARNNVVLTAYSLSGLAPGLISWVPADINNLGIRSGTGGNIFTVQTTPPPRASPPPGPSFKPAPVTTPSMSWPPSGPWRS